MIKERDSEDLIDKLEQFINLPHEEKIKMGLRGREKVEREFDRNVVVEKYIREIEKHGRV